MGQVVEEEGVLSLSLSLSLSLASKVVGEADVYKCFIFIFISIFGF